MPSDRLTLAEAVREIEALPDGYFGGHPATVVELDAVLDILARVAEPQKANDAK